MKFRPLHDRVVVTRIDAEAKTAGGIIIPDTAKEKPSEGGLSLFSRGALRFYLATPPGPTAIDLKTGNWCAFSTL